MPLTVTDPKNVKWLRQATGHGIDPDQVISTFRQMQQFNSRNQENSEQAPKISSSISNLPNSQAPMPLTVTDPKYVKWLRQATRHDMDPDQVLSTLRQMQQFNNQNQENSEQTPKIPSSLLNLPNSQAPMPLTVTDPKNVKWLRQAAGQGIDPDQVISAFRHRQQFNSQNQENSEQTPKISSSLLNLPNSQAPMPLTVTDPKNVKWLRQAAGRGIDPDQVISAFRQRQQFNNRNQENSEQILKMSSSLLGLPPSEYADRPNPQQHGSTKLTQTGKLRTYFY